MIKKVVLHITPHLGGGVGRVLLNYLIRTKKDSFFEHKVVCLEYANGNALKIGKNNNIKIFSQMVDSKKKLIKLISEADIVLVHWWNHPLLYDFLVRNELPLCRLVIWSHVSGFNPPYVFTKKILQYPDRFVFTTPVSLEAKEVKKLTIRQKKTLGVIWSTAGVEHVKSVKLKKHSGFNIGYIGTVDYAKLHPNFLNICNKINIPNVKFIVCGGSNEKEIKLEAEKLGIANKFNFTGQISDINKYLSVFDIFGYPLNPQHYGTCDQVLVESMATGIVPITLANRMEKYIVKNNITGVVANSENDYVSAIEKLYNNKSLKNLLSKNAKKYALNNFSLTRMTKQWKLVFKEVMIFPKTAKKWQLIRKGNELTAKDIFLESLGSYGKTFVDYCKAGSVTKKNEAEAKIIKLNKLAIWRAKTKGTVHHYCSFFPNDKYLTVWSKLFENNK